MPDQTNQLTFTSDKLPLEDLLKNIRSQEIQLPDFQRGWVWDDEHICELIESISMAYPMGTIMLLETGGNHLHFKPRPVADTQPIATSPKFLILDGQQRLTSLFHAVLSDKVTPTKDDRKKDITRWYYIDMNKAVDSRTDRRDAIISIPENKVLKSYNGGPSLDLTTRENEYKNCMFPLNLIFDSHEWRRGFNRYWEHSNEKANLFDDFESLVLDVFKRYHVPVILIKEHTPKEAVCQVFEKVNTGGVSLTVFELLTATFAADNFSLRDDWTNRHARLKERRTLKIVPNTDFLQAIALLVTYENQKKARAAGEKPENLPAVSCKRKDILKLNVEDYKKWADRVTEGFLWAERFLCEQSIYSEYDLPYRTQLVPLAAAYAMLGAKTENAAAKGLLAHWFWCGVLGELYGSAVESRFARDLPDLVEWVSGSDTLPKTVQDANFNANRLLTLRTRNSAAYKGIYALLMRYGCKDFRTGSTIQIQTYFDEQMDIHHIFPRDWCGRNRIKPEQMDCVVNKTPLSARTNRIIGGNGPSIYLKKLEGEYGIQPVKMDGMVTTHLVNPDHLRADNFSAFFQMRSEQILKLIGEAMGKPVSAAQPASAEDLIDYEGDAAEA